MHVGNYWVQSDLADLQGRCKKQPLNPAAVWGAAQCAESMQ